MRLKILAPAETVIDEDVRKVTGEAANGSFTPDGTERLLAVDHGILVKRADEVLVSTAGAYEGRELGALRETVMELANAAEDRDRVARSALARLEVNIVRRFIELRQ
jgi:F-type H+-transporting ATPase subunit epsilon